MKLFSLLFVAVFTANWGCRADEIHLEVNENEEDCVQELDVMIILDGSSSVTTSNFDLVKKWVKNLAVGLHIDHGHVQIGVVQYSSYVNRLPLNQQRYIRTEIELGEFTNKADFDAAVDGIMYQNGKKTFTAKAIEKTVRFDFSGKASRYPEARRNIILLTDGRAKDSDDLLDVIELAHSSGAYIIPIGVGNFNHDELVLLAHHHSEEIFEVENFDDLDSIVSDVHTSLQKICNCNPTGSLDATCDACTSQCNCRPNVEGIDCDKCVDGYFGFENPNGCEACECNPEGIEPGTSCDAETGVCICRFGFAGDACDVCQEGFYAYPDCLECECNGNAWECDDNGICINCTDGYVGDHCQYCGPGTYWNPDEEICYPCPCGGHIDVDDPDSCDPETGECLKCLGNRAGVNCELCEDFFFMQDGECVACGCNEEGTVRDQCLQQDMCMCDKQNGRCDCLPNVVGDKCDKCAPGYTGMEAGVGCAKCSCDEVGIMEQTLCDPFTGDCQCKNNHRGRHCRECDIGYARDDLQSPCIKIIPPTTTPAPPAELKEPTPPPQPKKALPVNPGWSPCMGCGGGSSGGSRSSYSAPSWPSYCYGYTCRNRYPYHQFSYSPRRCNPYNWGCRASVESYYTPSQQYAQASYNLYKPTRPRYVAPMMNRRRSANYNSRRIYNPSASSSHYGLYRRLRH